MPKLVSSFELLNTRLEPQIVVSAEPPRPADGTLLAVPLVTGGSPAEALAACDRRLGLGLAGRVDVRDVDIGEGGLVLVPGPERIALLGLGVQIDGDAVRTAAATAVRAARGRESTLAWAFDPVLLEPERQVQAVVDGVLLGGRDAARWKTSERPPAIERFVLAGAPSTLAAAAARFGTIARWTNNARDLVDAPPNELTPAGLADAATALLEGSGATLEILDAPSIEAAGLGGLAAVGRGSSNEPRLIVVRVGDGDDPAARLGLVGKGITFDSGGFFLKPQSDIVKQKADMGGAAAVLAAVGAIAELDLGLDVVAVIPAAENLLGGGAFRPGDVLTTGAGLTVEVTNPDAEGRLILADGLWYAKQVGVGHLIDVATLTGAMRGGMGDLYSGVFSNDEDWRDRIVAAGESSGDHAWPWPLHRRYDGPLESQLADLKNTAGRSFGYPIFAAAFLSRFVGTTPWAHIDIHSTAFLDDARAYFQTGATGSGVRLLATLAVELASAT